MTGDEYMMEGGVYGNEDRSDFYLKESGPATLEDTTIPMTFDLIIVTGSCNFCLTELSPDDAIRVGKFLIETAKDVKRRDATVSS